MKVVQGILDFLFPPKENHARVSATSIETLGALVRPFPLTKSCTALLPYRNSTVRSCILEAKFKDRSHAQTLLGRVLADYLLMEPEPMVLVPIPLSPARLKERGYNQVERVTHRAGFIYKNLLERTRDTLPQTSLSRKERSQNLKNAFRITGPLDSTYTYIVLDDVYTTGSTLSSAMEALRNAGATRVLGLTLAH